MRSRSRAAKDYLKKQAKRSASKNRPKYNEWNAYYQYVCNCPGGTTFVYPDFDEPPTCQDRRVFNASYNRFEDVKGCYTRLRFARVNPTWRTVGTYR